MAAFAPMPSASVTTTVAARPFARASERSAIRTSCESATAASNQRLYQILRIDSRTAGTYPNSRSAARRATSGSSPRSTRSFTLSAMWPRISSSSSRSSGRTLVLVAGGHRVHDSADRVHELGPAVALARQLRLASGRELVIPRPLVGLADAPLGLQPSAFHETVQRGIEGAGLDLEEVVGLRADRLADAVAVLRAPLKGPEDQHVERSLEQFEALFVGASGHDVDSLQPFDENRLQLVPDWGTLAIGELAIW